LTPFRLIDILLPKNKQKMSVDEVLRILSRRFFKHPILFHKKNRIPSPQENHSLYSNNVFQ
jgi:hypothetical protein